MQKGQLVLLGKSDTDALVDFPVDITFDGKKFSFQVPVESKIKGFLKLRLLECLVFDK